MQVIPFSDAALAGVKRRAAELPAERALARKAGLVLTGEELRARTKVPDRDNAAPIYRALTDYPAEGKIAEAPATKAVGDALAKLRDASTVSATNLATAKAALAQNAAWRKRLDPALSKASCTFARHWEDVAEVPFAEISTLRHGARLMALEAIVQSEEGKPIDALQTLSRAATLVRHAWGDGTLIPLLVGIAIESILDWAFHRVLRRHGKRPEVLTAAEATEKALDVAPNIVLGYGAEAVTFHAFTLKARAGKDRTDDLAAWGTHRGTLYAALEVLVLRRLRTLAGRRFDTDADLRALREWLRTEERSIAERATREADAKLMALVTGHIHSDVAGRLIERRAHTQLRAATIARLRNPNAKLPLDPFTGTPLRLRKTANGFVVWSLGANGKDDGGVAKNDLAVNWP